MTETFFLKLYAALFFIVLSLSFSTNAKAQDVPIEKIKKAIAGLSSYQDVPSSINCKTTKNKAEKIICGSEYLQLMEKLDTKAAIYAYENAMKIELKRDLKTALKYSLVKDIRKLTTEQAIREAYINHTNDSLGGISPYYVED